MKKTSNTTCGLGSLVLSAFLLGGANKVQAHCDTLDGPVVIAARKALAATNVNLVLIWVKQPDEAEIRQAFEKTLAVRKLSAEARKLADMYFFETLVRIHRAGEGAPYTGLKPEGNVGPAIPAADKAIENGKLEPVAKLLTAAVHDGLHQRFEEVSARKDFARDNVSGGREYVEAYVKYVHYVEGVYAAASGAVTEHGHESHAASAPVVHEHK
jgi:hypothetical protein